MMKKLKRFGKLKQLAHNTVKGTERSVLFGRLQSWNIERSDREEIQLISISIKAD